MHFPGSETLTFWLAGVERGDVLLSPEGQIKYGHLVQGARDRYAAEQQVALARHQAGRRALGLLVYNDKR